MRTDWFSRDAEPTKEIPAPMPPLGDGPPPELQPAKTLSDLATKREMQPPVLPDPAGSVEPAKPMTLKEVSQLLETAAKAVLDSKLSLEKAHVAMSKPSAMSGPSGMDKDIAAKSQGYASKIKNVGDLLDNLAKDISAYRDGLSRPRSPWHD